jgi:radical SAM superfamily enzyme YgiQ (UPF0313 family)
MSNLGFQNLFNRVSLFHGIRTVRFFLEKNNELYSPEITDPKKKEMYPSGVASLKGFDALFFSISFELDYINLIKMLIFSSIPPTCAERHSGGQRAWPFVVAGGIAVTANPYVISAVSEVAFVGDMEENLEKILDILIENIPVTRRGSGEKIRNQNYSLPGKLFEELDAVDGVYMNTVSGKTTTPKRSILKEIVEPAHTVVLTGGTEFSNMFLVEAVRGCKGSCLFCATRCLTGPVRPVKKKVIQKVMEKIPSGTKRAGLIGPVLTDNEELVDIVSMINEMGCSVSFSSLRADAYSDVIAGLLEKNRQNSVTFAPETGSLMLRKRIGKYLTDIELLNAVSLSVEHGIKNIRYYVMYGLPGEKFEDIKATADLVKKTVRLFKKPGYTLHISVNPFVPKKATPFESQKVLPKSYYMKMKEMLKGELSGTEAVSLKFDSFRNFYIHSILSIGDRDTGLKLCNSITNNSLKSFRKYAMEELLK